jgi:Flp pilus assembly protein TadG
MTRQARRKGATMLEFTLVGIGMIFVLISTFEVARGMWTYHTLAYAIREGTRYAAMHGRGCASPNTCQVNIGQIVTYIQGAGGAIDPDGTTLTFTPQTGSATTGTITSLSSNTVTFPPSAANAQGQAVKISARYQFQSILAMFWAVAAPTNDSRTLYLATSSTEPIQF